MLEHPLEVAIPSATGLLVRQAGGERYGTLILCGARAADLGPGESEQILALFKRMYCLYDEQPYVAWSAAEAVYCMSQYRSWRHDQRPPTRPPSELVASLRTSGEAALDAERVAQDLSFLTVENLVVALDDRWNSLAALFRHADRIVLAEWFTSA